MKLLRIRIGQEWSAGRMSKYLESLERLYSAHANVYDYDSYSTLTRGIVISSNFGTDFYTTEVLTPARQYELKLVRTHHDSPGFQDFTGFGEALKQLREFVKDVRDRKAQNRVAVAFAEEAEQDVLTKKLQNVERVAGICRENGFSKEATSKILKDLFVGQEEVEQLVSSGIIEEAELIESEEENEE